MLVWRQGSLSRFSGACNSSEYDDHANGPILSRVRRRWDYLCAYLSSRVYMYIVLLYAGMHDDHGSRCGNVRCVYIHVVCPVCEHIFVGLSTAVRPQKLNTNCWFYRQTNPDCGLGSGRWGWVYPPSQQQRGNCKRRVCCVRGPGGRCLYTLGKVSGHSN